MNIHCSSLKPSLHDTNIMQSIMAYIKCAHITGLALGLIKINVAAWTSTVQPLNLLYILQHCMKCTVLSSSFVHLQQGKVVIV